MCNFPPKMSIRNFPAKNVNSKIFHQIIVMMIIWRRYTKKSPEFFGYEIEKMFSDFPLNQF